MAAIRSLMFRRYFRSLALREDVVQALNESKFITPTEVQKMAISSILSRKKHVLINAETGSGKTLGVNRHVNLACAESAYMS